MDNGELQRARERYDELLVKLIDGLTDRIDKQDTRITAHDKKHNQQIATLDEKHDKKHDAIINRIWKLMVAAIGALLGAVWSLIRPLLF